MIDVGSRLRDYEIVARLKAGGMATLFLARRIGAAGFARHVAIKVVHPHLSGDPDFVRMFVEEAKLSARIVHPNVVHVEELGEADGTYFLVMEYVHGSALSSLLGALSHLERRLSPEIAVWVAMRVAEGLHAAHETTDEEGHPLGVVHRDVSPQNILVSQAGHVKLIDFGIAKASSSGKKTETGALKGKIRYMAPEQAFGASVDRRTDVYALGIVLWEMLTMQRMFRAQNDFALLDEVRNPRIEPPSAIAPDVPALLDQAVMRALAKDPAMRPASAQELRRMLGDAMPSANAVDPPQLAEVLDAVLGERMEQRRKTLPDSLSAIAGTRASKPGLGDRAIHNQDVLKSMTVSAPGVRYQPDGEISLAPPAQLDPRVPTGGPYPGTPFTASSVSAAPSSGPSRDRLLAIGAAAVALVALGVAGGLLVSQSARDADVPASPASQTSPSASPTTPSASPTASPTSASASPTSASASPTTPSASPTASPTSPVPPTASASAPSTSSSTASPSSPTASPSGLSAGLPAPPSSAPTIASDAGRPAIAAPTQGGPTTGGSGRRATKRGHASEGPVHQDRSRPVISDDWE